MPESTPDIGGDRIALLPGASCFEWQRREDLGFTIASVLAVLGLVAGLVGYWTELPIGLPGVFICLVACLFGWPCSKGYVARARSRRERAAGYTTIAEPHCPGIPLVSYRTGQVLRAAGAPPMSDKEYAAAVASESK